MILMFQIELAERIIAQPNSKSYGRLSVMAQVYTNVNISLKVNKNSFYPKPEVNSAVLKFKRINNPDLPNLNKFSKFVKDAFSHRRKTLKNNLSDKYKIEFPNITKEEYIKYDKNTLNLFELINDNNKTNNKILFHRQFDIYLILSLFIFFYYNVIRNNNYSLKNIITFISLAIFSLTIDNFLENYSVEIRLLIILNIINLLFVHIIIKICRMVKINV